MKSKSSFSLTIVLFFSLLSVSPLISQEFITEVSDTNDYDHSYLAITTTPHTIPKGGLAYQNLFGIFNTFEYGITDNFSLSSGFSLTNFGGDGFPPLFLLGKYNFYDADETTASISSLTLFFDGDNGRDLYSFLYTNIAFGTKDKFFTVGAGYSIIHSEDPIGILTFGYYNRVSSSFGLLIDVWAPTFRLERRRIIFPMPTIGLRCFFKNEITFDIGFPFIGLKIPLVRPNRSQRRKRT